MMRHTPAVVLGLSPTGLYAIRELGRAGVPVLAAASEHGPAAASRYAGLGVLVEPDPERRLTALLSRFPEDRPVILPTSDQDTEFVTRNASALAERFAFQASFSDGLADIFMTKSEFYRLAERHGLVPPRSWLARRSGLAALIDEVATPALLKPSRIHDLKAMMRGRKGWIAPDRDAFARLAREIPPGDYDLVVQEIVPGPESEITLWCGYLDREGVVRQSFTCRKLRQFPPGFGSASLVISHPEPDTREAAEAFLKAIGWQGVAAAEFKRDPRDGRLRIIEMNPRASLWFACATASRREVALAAWADLCGEEMPPERPQRNGVVWRYGVKDAYSAAFYRLNRGFVLPPPDLSLARRPVARVGAVHAPDDPAPFRADLAAMARKGRRRLGRQSR